MLGYFDFFVNEIREKRSVFCVQNKILAGIASKKEQKLVIIQKIVDFRHKMCSGSQTIVWRKIQVGAGQNESGKGQISGKR